jgi:cell filamentation protein
MSDDTSSPHGDRYDVSGNAEAQYVDGAEEVLINKKNITDVHTLHIEEEKGLARAYEQLLGEVRSDTPITIQLILYVHKLIFGELYEWAGRWRTVRISKPGVSWPPPDFLEQAMKDFEHDVLRKYPSTILKSDDVFCNAVGHIQGEFLAIHPFREGNARTIKLVTDLLATQSDRLPLQYDMTDSGRQTYIEAAKAALLKEYAPMSAVIHKTLDSLK